MTTRRFAFLSFTGGACFGFGIIGACAARSCYAISKANRWGDVRRLIGAK